MMTLAAASDAALGDYASEAVAAAADSSAGFTLQYSVTATPIPSLAFQTSPALVIIQQNQSTVITVSTTTLNGFGGTVNMFGIPQLPQGMTFSFSPATFSAGGSTQLTLTAGPDTLPGNYAMGVGGQSGSFGSGVPLYVTIMPASSLSLGLSPSSVELP